MSQIFKCETYILLYQVYQQRSIHIQDQHVLINEIEFVLHQRYSMYDHWRTQLKIVLNQILIQLHYPIYKHCYHRYCETRKIGRLINEENLTDLRCLVTIEQSIEIYH